MKIVKDPLEAEINRSTAVRAEVDRLRSILKRRTHLLRFLEDWCLQACDERDRLGREINQVIDILNEMLLAKNLIQAKDLAYKGMEILAGKDRGELQGP